MTPSATLDKLPQISFDLVCNAIPVAVLYRLLSTRRKCAHMFVRVYKQFSELCSVYTKRSVDLCCSILLNLPGICIMLYKLLLGNWSGVKRKTQELADQLLLAYFVHRQSLGCLKNQ